MKRCIVNKFIKDYNSVYLQELNVQQEQQDLKQFKKLQLEQHVIN